MRATKDKEVLCNFFIKDIKLVDLVMTGVTKSVPSIRFRLCIEGDDVDTGKEYSFPVSDIEKIPWKQLDIRCNYAPNVSAQYVERHLTYFVREKLKKASKNLIHQLSNPGMYIIDEKPVFCTGKEIIKSSAVNFSGSIEMAESPMTQILEIDSEMLETEAVSRLFSLLGLSPAAGLIIFSYNLGYLMRALYEKLGVPPKGCIYLYGDSGIQKTTFSGFLTQMYNRSKGIARLQRLNITIPAVIQLLSEHTENVVVLDDLFKTNSKKKRKEMEDTLYEVTRYIGDGITPARMKGKQLTQVFPRCGVIFIGEYVIGEGSDAARLLPVEMTKPDLIKLGYFQKNPLIVSTVYYNYIVWFVERYDEICEMLSKLLREHRKNCLIIHDRLKEMYFFLDSSYFLFLQYCYEKEILSKADVNRLYRSFGELLMKLVLEQNERVRGKKLGELKKEDYLQRICTLYKTGQMFIASDTETFDKEQHDGVLHRNRLYLRGDRVLTYFPESTMKDIADSLEAQGVLEVGKRSRTKQISGLNGLRFYVILLNYLS